MNPFFRYALVGAGATLVHYALLVAGVALAGWPAWLCAGLAAALGAQVAFVGNRHFTFPAAQGAAVPWLRFQCTALAGAVVSMGLVAAVVAAGGHYLAGQVLATLCVLVLGFRINRAWSFAGPPEAVASTTSASARSCRNASLPR